MRVSKRDQLRLVINPMQRLAAKNLVGDEGAFDKRLEALLHLDAAKRGRLPAYGYNRLATIVLASAGIPSPTQSKRFYDVCTAAYRQPVKAGMRPTELLDLSTTEYKAIREAIAWYVRALPGVEVGVVESAFARAQKALAAA
jgi:hypothetical protein